MDFVVDQNVTTDVGIVREYLVATIAYMIVMSSYE